MKKIIALILLSLRLVTLDAIELVNTTNYPIEVWVPYPREVYEQENPPVDDAQYRSLLVPGQRCQLPAFPGVTNFYLNVKFHPKGMKKSCPIDSVRIDQEDDAAYNIYLGKIDDINLRYGSVLNVDYSSWAAMLERR